MRPCLEPSFCGEHRPAALNIECADPLDVLRVLREFFSQGKDTVLWENGLKAVRYGVT